MNFANWQIDEDGIKHLHQDEEPGSVVSYESRKVCESCNEVVPPIVAKLAENKGAKVDTTANKDGKGKKRETEVKITEAKPVAEETAPALTAEDLLAQLEAHPQLKADLQAKLGVRSGNGGDNGLVKLKFEKIPAVMLFFPDGKPPKETRELLKSLGFTWRPGTQKGEERGTWVGPLNKLAGTPFQTT